ncbi:leucine-rich repeat domain-containing protein [Vibrio sp. SCSIO 43137]|uniref:leucine-rich repeat domain-containing protein n=1 Tax=Vibrio sp. SCSIO 43137 TaxID=3021011 RepID=UPI0023073BF4|nr:leucine-rich repeat domain-containing protein [Vibrio sp. SCSIO 43137]WCE32214.1 leucine-rich repeat domain-containing protein [Vibrio sp. SCSIO 43137]
MPDLKANTLKRWSQTLVVPCLLFALTACGGGESGTDSSGIQHEHENQANKYVSVYAEDFYKVVQSDEQQEVRVDITEKVMRSGGEPIEVIDIEVLSSDPSCRPLNRDKAGFNIVPDRAMVCDYQYTVGLDEAFVKRQLVGKQSGISRVVMAKDANQAELVPFGVSGYQGETLVIKIAEQLAAAGDKTDLTDYTLTNDYVLIPEDSSSDITLDIDNKTITYKPDVNFEGNKRILYTLKNGGGSVKAGSAVVAVSKKSAQGITIQDKIVISKPVALDGTNIDITPYVTVENSSGFQLIQVVSFDAIVALADKFNPENKKFTFKAERPGHYYVNAVVTDHKGGFDAGLIRITVGQDAASLWEPYYHNGYAYSAPLTEQEASQANVAHDGFIIDFAHPAIPAVAVFKNNNAKSYCADKGSLPTAELLKSVWQSDKNNQKNWPLSRGYLVQVTDDTFGVVSLSNGQDLASDGKGYYVTCMKKVGYILQASDVLMSGNMITKLLSDTQVIGTEIYIPSSINGVEVKSIGSQAFANTSQYGKDLTSLVIEEGITSIGYYTFASNDLKNLVLPNSLTTIGEGAFANNQLTSLSIPKDAKTIGSGAFTNNKLAKVTFNDGLETIGKYAFNVNQLTDVTIPASVKKIDDGAFQSNQLEGVELNEGLNTIGAAAFRLNKLTDITIPKTVSIIRRGAFNKNELVSVTLSGAINRVEAAVFDGHDALRKVTVVGKSILGKDLKRMFTPAGWVLYHNDGTPVDNNDMIQVGETVYFGLEYIGT